MLDKLGYKDRNGDGFREDPNGKPFEINLKHYAGSNPTFEPRTAATKISGKSRIKTNVKMVEFGKYNDDLASALKIWKFISEHGLAVQTQTPSDLYHY